MPDQRVVCLIPARGGSKRIPRKNIRQFHGKPLIAWSIEAAFSSALFDEVYVSTDDPEIAQTAITYGANIPFIRPQSLSDDFATDHDVRHHFLSWSESNSLCLDTLCYLYPTAPFITPQVLKQCYRLLVESEATQVQTITTYSYPVQRSLAKDQSGHISFQWEEYSSTRSQDLPELYHDAAQCYFYDLRHSNRKPLHLGFELPRIVCHDIDTLEDLQIAEHMFTILRDSSASTN